MSDLAGFLPNGRLVVIQGVQVRFLDVEHGRTKTRDRVQITGGILGKVTAVSEHYATLQIADDVEVKVQKSTVSAVVPKGTFDAA